MVESNVLQREHSTTENGEPTYEEIHRTIAQLTPQEAIGILEPFIAGAPLTAMAHNDLAVSYYLAGEIDKAEQAYVKAVELDPHNPISLKNLADFYFMEKEDLAKAMKGYLAVLKIDPEDVEVLKAIGVMNLVLGHHGDARTFFDKVKQLAPDDAQIDRLEAQLRGANPTMAVSQNPADPQAAYVTGLKKVQGDDARRYIHQFLTRHPDFATAHNDLGVLYIDEGQIDAALESYRQAVRLAPQNSLFRKNLADLHYIEKADPISAMRHYNEVLRDDPKDTEALFAVGRISAESGDFETAAALFETLIEIDPHHENARVQLDLLQNMTDSDSVINGETAAVRPMTETLPANTPDARTTAAWIREAPNDRLASALANTAIYIYCTGDAQDPVICLESLSDHTSGCPVFVVTEDVNRGMLEAVRAYGASGIYLRPFGEDEASLAEVINTEIRHRRHRFIAILSSAVKVEPNWLSHSLASLLSDRDAVLVSPLKASVQSSVQIASRGIGAGSERLSYDAFLDQHCRHRRLPMRQVEAACTIIDAEAFGDIGPLDGTLGTYSAAMMDWIFRARIEGKTTIIAGDVLTDEMYADTPGRQETDKLQEKWNRVPVATREGRAVRALHILERLDNLHATGDTPSIRHLVNDLEAIDIEQAAHRAHVLAILIDLKLHETAAEFADRFNASKGGGTLTALCGYVREGLGDLDAADGFVQRALEEDPECALSWNLAGLLSVHANDLQSAESHFRKAIALDPGYGDPYANLATLLWDHLDPAEAFGLYEKAFSLSPTSSDLIELYQNAIHCFGQVDRGRKMVEEALNHYPNHRLLTYFHIDLSLQTGADQETVRLIQNAIVRFGVDDGILEPALKVRGRLGPLSNLDTHQNGPFLSICLIVKNEEACLASCLQSVQGLADEIVIVDTGSTDRTEDIATVFGAKLHSVEWQGDFSAARNVYLEKAAGEWILVLDADEVVSPNDHAHIRELMRCSEGTRTAYTITTRNYDSNPTIIGWTPNRGEYRAEERGNGWIPTYKVRLFPNDSNLRYTFPVHEMLEPSLKENGYRLKPAEVPVHHYGKLNVEKTKQKHTVYYELGLKKLAENGEDPYALRELAIQAGLLQRYEEAISLWERFTRQKPEIPEAYINMGTAYFQLGEYQRALENAVKAVERAPHFRESRYNHAIVLIHLGRVEEALPILEPLCQDHARYLPGLFLLASGYLCAGDLGSARKTFKRLKATPLGPMLSVSFETFVEGLLKAEQFEYALQVAKGAFDCRCGSDSLRRTVAKLENEGRIERHSPEG